METIAQTVDKVDSNLESMGIEGVGDSVKEIGYSVLNWKQYLKEQLPTIAGFGIKVVFALLAFIIGRRLIKWVLRVMQRSLEKANVDKGVVQFINSLGKIVLYAILILNIGMSFGIEASSVAALLGTAGVTLGLALQGGLTNIAGGVMILVFKPFQVGDYIIQNIQNGCEGTVYKVEMCYTTLLSVDNKKVIIPNGILSNSTIINVTAREKRKLEMKIGISYDSDIQKAKEILLKLLNEDPDVKSDEEMLVYVDELAASSVMMGLRVWVLTDAYMITKWRLNEKIKTAFDEQGIQIPFSQMEVHVHHRENGEKQ